MINQFMGMTRSHPHELIYHMGDLPCDELIFFFSVCIMAGGPCTQYGRRALYAPWPAGLVRMAGGRCTHGRRALHAWPAGFVRRHGRRALYAPWQAGLVRMAGGPCTHHGRRALYVTTGHVQDWQGYVPVAISLVKTSDTERHIACTTALFKLNPGPR